MAQHLTEGAESVIGFAEGGVLAQQGPLEHGGGHRVRGGGQARQGLSDPHLEARHLGGAVVADVIGLIALLQRRCRGRGGDRKSTRLNSSHVAISYAVICLKKKKNEEQ